MKFQLAINLERMDDSLDMKDVARHTLEMVQMADQGGFNIVWAAEHHALEMTIAPNPFSILTWWAGETDRIRLGTACVAAAYWHPIKVAGEAAFVDLISGGRLEFGIGSGAYQREFDRMHPGLKQSDAWQYMQEMLPAVRALWQGDYAHEGKFWNFPTSTACPKPLQADVPVWIAARAPITYDYAVKNGCNIMSWPLTRDMSEAELYWMVPVRAAQRVLSQFENLFKNMGDVTNGFPKSIPFDQLGNRAEYDPEMLQRNLMFGTPDEVITKLKLFQALGVDEFIYYASLGLGLAEQKRSLELFINDVMPAFA